MSKQTMSSVEAWLTLLPEHGSLIQVMLSALLDVRPKEFEDAIERIQREISIGPLLRPSGYTDGRVFKNAEDYVAVFRALKALRNVLPPHDSHGKPFPPDEPVPAPELLMDSEQVEDTTT